MSVVASSPFSLSITWSDPLQATPSAYSISIDFNNDTSTNDIVSLSPEGHYQYRIGGLHPYQYVTVTVANLDSGLDDSVTISSYTEEYCETTSVTIIVYRLHQSQVQ